MTLISRATFNAATSALATYALCRWQAAPNTKTLSALVGVDALLSELVRAALRKWFFGTWGPAYSWKNQEVNQNRLLYMSNILTLLTPFVTLYIGARLTRQTFSPMHFCGLVLIAYRASNTALAFLANRRYLF